MKQALQIQDLTARCDELFKIYMADSPYSPPGNLALKGIVDCGKVGMVKLIPMFQAAQDHDLDRRPILIAWQRAGYKEAGSVIVKWLQTEEAWWAGKSVADKIWASKEGQRGGDDPRGASFRNIYCSVESLAGYPTPESRWAIEQVRRDWLPAAPFDSNNDLLKVCDDSRAALQ